MRLPYEKQVKSSNFVFSQISYAFFWEFGKSKLYFHQKYSFQENHKVSVYTSSSTICYILHQKKLNCTTTNSSCFMQVIVAHMRLPFFKIFSNFVHFCPKFKIFCPFFTFSEKLHTRPYFLEQALYKLFSCIWVAFSSQIPNG